MEEEEGEGIIRVMDNGRGIAEEKLAVLKQQLDDCTLPAEKGVGIRNVNRMMKAYYGRRYGLTIENGREQGAVVTFRFRPVQEEIQEDRL